MQKWSQNCWMIIRRSTTCKCVRTSSSVFKMNQACFVEPSLVFRYRFLSMTWKPNPRAVRGSLQYHRGWRKQNNQSQSQNHVDHILWCEGHCSQWVLSIGQNNQSVSLQGDSAAYALLSAWEEVKVVAGQIMATSSQQHTCLQCPGHLAVTGQEKHCHIRTTSLLICSCCVTFFLFSKFKGIIRGRCGEHQEGHNIRAEGHPKRILPAVHRSMLEKDGKVH